MTAIPFRQTRLEPGTTSRNLSVPEMLLELAYRLHATKIIARTTPHAIAPKLVFKGEKRRRFVPAVAC